MKQYLHIDRDEETGRAVDSIQDCLNRLSTAVENLTEVLISNKKEEEAKTSAEEQIAQDRWSYLLPEEEEQLKAATRTSDTDIEEVINTIISGLTFTTRG